ncbi:hypothetical protein MMC15_004843 [Xylographa vitiligo]|nr:hypothetical protein [Xylographa vitiligo]
MSVEALTGTDESFDPFFAQTRPHPGQKEATNNIAIFLGQSKLVHRSNGTEASLRQDRYSIRTASQWIGPVLEDLLLANKQVVTELYSVTDNPVIDGAKARILHGGNSQAKAIISAMEKSWIASETRRQCIELINPATSRGLPPNLGVNEPSVSFIWKGTDIFVSALQSELGFLANLIGSHVQTAEMGNQALLSLALISGRFTLDAIAVLSQLAAAHLLALCQAFDLQVMQIRFLEDFEEEFIDLICKAFSMTLKQSTELHTLSEALWQRFRKQLNDTTGLDSDKRFEHIAYSLQPAILLRLTPCAESVVALELWTQQCAAPAYKRYQVNRSNYLQRPDARPFLGRASSRIYSFVREKLSIPFVNENNIRTPVVEKEEFLLNEASYSKDEESPATIGSYISTIYQSIRNVALYSVTIGCLQEIVTMHELSPPLGTTSMSPTETAKVPYT